MNRISYISATEDFVRQHMKDYDSGHDWWHIERVRRLSEYINEKELFIADPFALEIAVLLHDTLDSKFIKKESDKGYGIIEKFMDNSGMSGIRDQVIEAIKNVSFSNASPTGNLRDPVFLVLQDADRLDAIGAIGIARAFNYGGFRNNPIFIPDEVPDGKSRSTIGHFYDKLLKLKGLMNTVTGKYLAEERHRYIELYLEQFYKEWEFKSGPGASPG